MRKIYIFFFTFYLAFSLDAQFSAIHLFSGPDGAFPTSGMIYVGDSLYGVTTGGGINNFGVLYRIHPNGGGFTKLFDFDSINGIKPQGSLSFKGDTLFGMTMEGGDYHKGVLFSINKDGSNYKKLRDLADADGIYPKGSLLVVNDYLYGMARDGGTHGYGTVFRITTKGKFFVKLLDFDKTKGAYPCTSFIFSNGFLYGVASLGGSNDQGTCFKIKPDGTGFTKLKDFDGASSGSNLHVPLKMIGDTIWCSTLDGGAFGLGTICKMKSDGSGFKKLIDIQPSPNGGRCSSSLLFDGMNMFGTTATGGQYDTGSIFQLRPDGSGFLKQLDFQDTVNGSLPQGNLVIIDSVIYGTTFVGGAKGHGVIYKMKFSPKTTSQATDITDQYLTETDISITWIKSSSYQNRGVFTKEGSDIAAKPVNHTTYMADAEFKKGSQIDTTNWYCVYNGSKNSAIIKGLKPGTTYSIMVCEYNGAPGSEVYQTVRSYGNPVLKTTAGQATLRNEIIKNESCNVYPNPAKTILHVDLPSAQKTNIKIFDNAGKQYDSFIIYEKQNLIDVGNLAGGIYFIQISSDGLSETKTFRVE